MKSECKTEQTSYGYTINRWYIDGELVLEEAYTGEKIAYRKLPTEFGMIHTQHGRGEEVPGWLRLENHEGQMHSNTAPSYVFYHKDGSVWRETWHKNGVKHRDGGEPAEIHYREDGMIHWKEWYVEGKRFRDPENILPSLEIWNYKTGKLSRQSWTNANGNAHRDDDLPSSVSHEFNTHGELMYTIERWHQDGVYARAEGKPNYVKTLPNGTVIERRWSIDGRLGREGGKPAIEKYHHDGTLWHMEWWENGIHHRADGPALVQHQKKGLYETYYLNGVWVPDMLVTDPESITYETVLASDKNREVKWEMIKILGLEKFIETAPKQELDSDDESVLYKISMGYGWGSKNRDFMSKTVPDDWGLHPEKPLVVLVHGDVIICLPENIETLEEAWKFDHNRYYWPDRFRGFTMDDLTVMELD